jgi:murein DD-endopeptidase
MEYARFATTVCMVAVLALSTSIRAFAQTREPLVESFELTVPYAPAVAHIGGKRHLAYELHITNLRPVDIALTSVALLDASRANTTVAEFRDEALGRTLDQPGAAAEPADKRLIAAGTRAVLYLWQPLDTATPRSVSHRIEFDVLRRSGRSHATMQGGSIDVRDEPPLLLHAPLRGGRWVAIYDPAVNRGHRRVLYTIDGRTRIPARFAIDWMKLGDDGAFARGDRSRIGNWHGYGADVLAVADAIVTDAKDDIIEPPAIADNPPATSLETMSGNYVVLDLGNRRYAFYEHLKHGSVRVKAGDRVKSGQVLAQLGNSGSSSSGPHLHFHVADAPSALGAEGLPYVFSRFDVLGQFESMAEAESGASRPSSTGNVRSTRQRELPAPNSIVEF